MSIYDLKPRFQALLRPVCQSLADRGVTPNQITWSALLLSVLTGAWIALQPDQAAPLLWLPLALFLRMALNAIDGMLAREHNLKSHAGALLNEVGDILSDTVLYLPLAAVQGFPETLIVIVVILAGLSESAGLAAVLIGASRNYRGPMGKSDRAFVFGALAFFLGIGVPLEEWISWILVVVNGLLVLTVWNRCRSALSEAGTC